VNVSGTKGEENCLINGFDPNHTKKSYLNKKFNRIFPFILGLVSDGMWCVDHIFKSLVEDSYLRSVGLMFESYVQQKRTISNNHSFGSV
jgi:hypothetical protein